MNRIQEKKSKIKQLLVRAKDELSKYRSYKKFANLSQACEKTWVAFALLVELKTGKELSSNHSIEIESDNLGTFYSILYRDCFILHVVHYEGGYPDLNEQNLLNKIVVCISKIKNNF